MQMISAVKLGQQAKRVRRIAQSRIKIDDTIKSARGSDPLIHRFAFGLACCGKSWVTLIRKNCSAENLEAGGTRASDNLLVANDNFIRRHLRTGKARICGCSRVIGLANIVGALE